MPKLLIADDHRMFAASLVSLLRDAWPDILHSPTIDETIRELGTQTIDVLILDVDFQEPQRTGFDVLRHCTRHFPSVTVILLTAWAEPWIVEAAKQDGARGCLGKFDDPELLVQAVQTVLEGGEWWTGDGEKPLLTERQIAVIRGLAEGLTHDAVARRLGCAEVTVDAHLKLIKRRLRVSSTAEALVKGTEMGLFLRVGPNGRFSGGGGGLSGTSAR